MKLIEIGKVVRSHGLRGRIKVLSYLQASDALENVDDLLLGESSVGAASYRLSDVQDGSGFFILKLVGIDNHDDAEKLRGMLVWTSADRMKPLEDDEYYWHDIVGIQVFTDEGALLGRIESIFPTGSNDVYVCSDGKREILIPAIGQVVKKIDIERDVMIVECREGFFD
jgi:16S rRNA processing protein RimM